MSEKQNLMLEQTAPEARALGEAMKAFILDNINVIVQDE
jgi:hypothetical protein